MANASCSAVACSSLRAFCKAPGSASGSSDSAPPPPAHNTFRGVKYTRKPAPVAKHASQNGDKGSRNRSEGGERGGVQQPGLRVPDWRGAWKCNTTHTQLIITTSKTKHVTLRTQKGRRRAAGKRNRARDGASTCRKRLSGRFFFQSVRTWWPLKIFTRETLQFYNKEA